MQSSIPCYRAFVFAHRGIQLFEAAVSSADTEELSPLDSALSEEIQLRGWTAKPKMGLSVGTDSPI
jgi:hypothetical protein